MQGIGSIAGLTVLGVEMTDIRGVTPSKILVRLIPSDSFDRFTGDLTFTWGTTTRTYTECATSETAFRVWHGRDGWRWEAIFNDRRWKWRYPRIDGEYNVRLCDGRIDPNTKKTARELGTLLFQELGETQFDVSDLPRDAFPYVNWRDAVARFELQWLSELYSCVVCPKKDDTFAVERITQTASLPAGGVPVTPPDFSHKPAIMPSALQVSGADKVFQGMIPLTSVGLDIDGTIQRISSLSYSPSWQHEWWGAFPNVPQQHRHLAFQTVHRWFQPNDPDIVLLEHSVETGVDIHDKHRCLPPQVNGIFWPLTDHPENTTEEAIHAGPFRIRKDLNLVEFEYPVVKWDNGRATEPTLWITTAYKKRTGSGFEKYTKNESVPDSVKTTEPRVLQHPELMFIDLQNSLYMNQLGDNSADVDAEAQVYLDEVGKGYTYTQAQDVIFNGIEDVSLSGGIAQLRYQVGNERPAFTRVGVNTEFDIYEAHYQERRARERLSQMAERQQL